MSLLAAVVSIGSTPNLSSLELHFANHYGLSPRPGRPTICYAASPAPALHMLFTA